MCEGIGEGVRAMLGCLIWTIAILAVAVCVLGAGLIWGWPATVAAWPYALAFVVAFVVGAYIGSRQ